MVRNYFSLIFFIHLFISGTINAQTTAIPDTAFEEALIDLGIDSDGTINELVHGNRTRLTAMPTFLILFIVKN